MRPTFYPLAFILFTLPTALLPGCGKSNYVHGIFSAGEPPKIPTGVKPAPTCHDPNTVLAGKEYTCADGKKLTGKLHLDANASPVLPCTKDNEKGCVTTDATSAFLNADREKLVSANLKQGITIAGVTGNLVLPLAGSVRTGVNYGPSGAISGALGDCMLDGSTNCVAVVGFRSANESNLASKVLSGQIVAGVAGNVALPVASAVRASTTFGANGATSGMLADCSADGASGCFVPTNGTIRSADTANFTGWDVRRKRNSSGSILTFAGLTGLSKSCRNRANTTVYDNAVSPAGGGLDFFDTIDDNNNSLLGLPPQVPAWTMIIGGSTVIAGNDYKCGGIYATGSVATGNTGADASLAHDPDGNWQDLTPGIIPGGAKSINPANGCNASDKHCVFKELISGLLVTKVTGAPYNWGNSITYCDNLGKAGGTIISPIPAIGGATFSDWRLPTQKELMHLHNAGINGLNQSANLKTFFGNVDAPFWSSSSVSTAAMGIAWVITLHNGITEGIDGKSAAFKAICVR